MSKYSSTKKIIHQLVWRLLWATIFVTVAGTVVILALGYRVNLDQLTLEATGAVTLNGKLSDIKIFANNKLVGDKLPITITGQNPTRALKLKITKDDYTTWEQSVAVEPGLVTSVGEIKLWLETPVLSDAREIEKLQSCEPLVPNGAEKLLIFGGEIRTKSHLITRSSSPIAAACWFSDNNHVVFATAHDVIIIELDGDNMTTVFSTDQTIQTIIPVGSDSIYVNIGDANWKKVVVIK